MESRVPESVYYARQLRLPGFSLRSQQKLGRARALIIGIGGLGCPAAMYMTGAGIGTIALCDGDAVSPSNLHRQILFNTDCLGARKVNAAAERLRLLNPNVTLEVLDSFAGVADPSALVSQFDVVVDGTDNHNAKYLINDACESARVPLVYGSIYQYEGQLSVFHYSTLKALDGFSLRDLYPAAPPSALAQSCGEAGVLGVLPGVIGVLQATEAIKVITGIGDVLSGVLLTFDALTATFRKLALAKASEELSTRDSVVDEMTADELRARLRSGVPTVLIDVRDAEERAAHSLGGRHVPLAELPNQLDRLPADGEIVVYCKSGARSARAALYIRSVKRGVRVWSLRGGLDGVDREEVAACSHR